MSRLVDLVVQISIHASREGGDRPHFQKLPSFF